MTRRELIALLGSTAAMSWPLGASAQQPERIPRIGVLMTTVNDAVGSFLSYSIPAGV